MKAYLEIEMPRCCNKCPMLVYEGHTLCICRALPAIEDGEILKPWKNKRKDCPLKPIQPHGRLIDADALMNEFEKAQRTMQQHGREYSCSFMSSSQEISTEWYCVEDMVENAPTIIPASEEGKQ